jgi:hypothetical protein
MVGTGNQMELIQTLYHFFEHENNKGKPKISQMEDTQKMCFSASFITGIRGDCGGNKEGASSEI